MHDIVCIDDKTTAGGPAACKLQNIVTSKAEMISNLVCEL